MNNLKPEYFKDCPSEVLPFCTRFTELLQAQGISLPLPVLEGASLLSHDEVSASQGTTEGSGSGPQEVTNGSAKLRGNDHKSGPKDQSGNGISQSQETQDPSLPESPDHRISPSLPESKPANPLRQAVKEIHEAYIDKAGLVLEFSDYVYLKYIKHLKRWYPSRLLIRAWEEYKNNKTKEILANFDKTFEKARIGSWEDILSSTALELLTEEELMFVSHYDGSFNRTLKAIGLRPSDRARLVRSPIVLQCLHLLNERLSVGLIATKTECKMWLTETMHDPEISAHLRLKCCQELLKFAPQGGALSLKESLTTGITDIETDQPQERSVNINILSSGSLSVQPQIQEPVPVPGVPHVPQELRR